jgi:lysophosphatidylcholine acyltransferase/lyso-PAF acetyltransferase
MIMEGKVSGKLCIFPEGATSNGKYLLTFKKGAFASLTPLKPFITKGRGNSFDMSFGAMNISLHIYISLTYLYHSMDINELPVIAPTEYLFENYKHLGKDKVEIFQEGVKEILSEIGGFKKSSLSYDRKFEYLSEIHGKVVKNT